MSIDMYRRLNDSDPINLHIPIEDLVKQIVSYNYGTHRLLSALVHVLRERSPKEDPSRLADVIEKALNDGLFY